MNAAPIVRDAHERLDGLGYPLGIYADEVCHGARIVCVADAYDTMTLPRVYPAVVNAFRRIIAGL